ncbi:MAG: HPF/RaiA family ribosome-associated protein [Candidatus Pacebacteria bacterium]|nr:HPF/RaiA family ribosome-associated protein [Candidatus Paceibacterota bacterium]
MVNLNISSKDYELTDIEREFINNETSSLEEYLEKINKDFTLNIHIRKKKSKKDPFHIRLYLVPKKYGVVIKERGSSLRSLLDNLFEEVKARLIKKRDKKKSKFIKKAASLKKKIIEKYFKF